MNIMPPLLFLTLQEGDLKDLEIDKLVHAESVSEFCSLLLSVGEIIMIAEYSLHFLLFIS